MTAKRQCESGGSNVQFRRNMTIVRALTVNRYGLTKAEIMDRFSEDDIPQPTTRTFLRDIAESRL